MGIERRWSRVWRAGVLAGLAAWLAACAHAPAHNPLATWVPSPNADARRPVIIVLHYTEQDSVQQSLHTLRTRNSGGPVSAHYLIGADGHRYQLVADDARAWHAGGGRWGTITDLNSASIGIELDNDGRSPFAQAQIDSLLVLLQDLTTRLRIPRTQVIGHEDLAPSRKTDPGPLFPWRRLAQAGFGRWPSADAPPAPAGFDPWPVMAAIGWPLDDRADAVRAFRHHYRGVDRADLRLDAEDLRILYDLGRQVGAVPALPAASAVTVDTSRATTAAQAGLVDVATLAPGIALDMRYAGAHNFVGRPIAGYQAGTCLLLAPVAQALAEVQADLQARGLRLKMFDCYRPVRAVADFMHWAADPADQRAKAEFYPDLDKARIVPEGYVAAVSGHSRGATVDLTVQRCSKGQCTDLDMGTGFDFFGALANTDDPRISPAQRANRALLRTAMARHGFANYAKEWWHYTLKPEPAPTLQFDVPVE